MATNCAPRVADLILFCYERYYVVSKQMLLKHLILPQDI